MIRTLYRNNKGNVTTDLPQTHWKVALHDKGGLFWVDFEDEPEALVEPLLRELFGFHALAIDDALRESHVPKIDNWGEYVYIVVHGLHFHPDTFELETHEVDLFLGANFIVSLHQRPVGAINRVWSNLNSDPRRLERGADHLLYDILDFISTDYLPAADALDDAIDHLEDEVFGRPNQRIVSQIFAVKRAVLRMRRVIVPQREVLNRLARDDYAMIDPADRVYFRDVYDHLVRLVDLTESLRDLIGGTLDTYLSVSANRTNEVMKVLTIISALFMPVSFLAGFFGMNFLGLPFDNPLWLGGALAAMVVIPAGMLVWFRRNGWF